MKKTHFIALFLIVFVVTAFNVPSTVPSAATSLRVAVLDNLGNMIEGATVTLYATQDDYRNETNPAQEPAVTNEKGVVKFKKIEAAKYFIYVTKGDLNNIGNGVETDPLEEGKVNKITIVIE